MSLYQAILLDHFKHPRRAGVLPVYTFSCFENNPLCGDEIMVYGLVQNGKLVERSFTGTGCVISQATASLLLDSNLVDDVAQIASLGAQDVLELIGMEQLGPNRLKCALLPLIALQRGLRLCEE
jgi:nitrogen fixation NifU-like protein